MPTAAAVGGLLRQLGHHHRLLLTKDLAREGLSVQGSTVPSRHVSSSSHRERDQGSRISLRRLRSIVAVHNPLPPNPPVCREFRLAIACRCHLLPVRIVVETFPVTVRPHRRQPVSHHPLVVLPDQLPFKPHTLSRPHGIASRSEMVCTTPAIAHRRVKVK